MYLIIVSFIIATALIGFWTHSIYPLFCTLALVIGFLLGAQK